MLLEESNVKVTTSSYKAVEKPLHSKGGVKKLESGIEVDVCIVEAMKQ
jgi:hypothetical protein